MSRQKSLSLLQQELNTLSTFDRLHDLATNHNEVEGRAYEVRQMRRSEIAAEIERLKASEAGSLKNHVRLSSGFVLLCAVGYASLRYLLR